MSDANKAVFLSYASQDAAAAKRICEVLRASGVEVWFDQSELVGGDAWDQKIRRQIKDCALLIPIISAATQARTEGYFRLEWRLADQRTHLMAKGRPFLLPVVIDDTHDADAHVPDSFTEVQWTRLPGGATPPKFAERVSKLLSGTVAGVARSEHVESADPGPASPRPATSRLADQSDDKKPKRWLAPVIAGAVVVLLILAISRPWDKAQSPAAAAKAVVSLTEARRLAEQARALLLKPSGGPSKYDTAVLLCDRALVLDPTDAEVWAIASQVDTKIAFHSFDRSEKRIESAQSKAAKARNLAPGSFEARLAQGMFQAMIGGQPVAAEAEATLRALHTENPREYRVFDALGVLLRDQGRGEEAVACFDEAARLPDGAVSGLSQKAWALRGLWRFDEADAALDRSIALQPIAGNIGLKVFLDLSWRGDPDRALATLRKLPADELTMDVGVAAAVRLYRWRREPAEVLKFLASVPREWMTWSIWGPKAALTGDANAGLNKLAAARTDWETALALVVQRLAVTPNDRNLFEWKAYLEASLGERAKAEESWQRSREAPGQGMALLNVEKIHRVATPEQVIDELERRAQDVRDRLEHIQPFPVAFISAADLRLNPAWDRVRSLPRFQALQAELDADPRFNPNARRREAAATAAVDEKSVAVLAFANLSDDRNNEYFSDGISEELLNVLSNVQGLKVSARTSAFYFKGKEVPVPEIAQKLGVAYVVEGSVRKAGNQVRITAQLIKAADGFHVWSDTFTRDLKDVFAVQDEIAGLIAKNLELKMGVTSNKSRREVNPEAHRLVLEGRFFWNPRTTEGFVRAEAAFRKAIALDPDFAQAHAGLADVLATSLAYAAYAGRTVAPMQLIRDEAQRAIALDPTLPEAYPALGLAYSIEGRHAEAEGIFRKVLAMNPNYALPHHWYALALEMQGRLDDALAEMGRATELDPLSGIALISLARLQMQAGRYTEALATLDRVQFLLPDRAAASGNRALCLLGLGRPEEAAAAARTTTGLGLVEVRMSADAEAVHVLRQTGHEAEAAEQAQRILPHLAADSYQRGLILAAQDRWPEALPFLERTPVTMQFSFFWNPIWDPWREDPRFHLLLEKLGCAEEYKVARAALARMRQEQAAKK
jgi:TolB-like protein/Flp pilus assembly protein TadD